MPLGNGLMGSMSLILKEGSMKVEVVVEVNRIGANYIEIIELPDNATEEEIQEAVEEVFYYHCSYGYTVLDKD